MLDLNNNLIPSKNVNLNNNDAVNMALEKEEAEDKKKQMEDEHKKEHKKKSSSFTSKINNKLLKYKADKLITQYLHLTSFDKKKSHAKNSKQSLISSSSDSSLSPSNSSSSSISSSSYSRPTSNNSSSKQVSLSKANQIFTITNICSLLSAPSPPSSISYAPLIDKHFFHKFSYFNSLLVFKALRLKQKPQSICSSHSAAHLKPNELAKTIQVDECEKSRKLNEKNSSTRIKENNDNEQKEIEKKIEEKDVEAETPSKTKRMKRFASFKRREFILRLLDFNFLILF